MLISEIAAAVAVVISLAILIYEVRQNTQAMERQTHIDRVASLTQPYLQSPIVAETYARIKSKDGVEPIVAELRDNYELSVEQAVVWRNMLEKIWITLEAEFLFDGPSEALGTLVADLAEYPDNRIYLRHSGPYFSPAFMSYVEENSNRALSGKVD